MSGCPEVDEILQRHGLLVPEFVQVQDGFYTERIVLDAVPPAGPVSEGPTFPETVAFHTERLPLPLPRYRTELVWREKQWPA